jgi:glycosyltransferase involved in cell wall biosynthesis
VRVLLVVHGYPPSSLGGTEVHTQAVAHGLAARGHDVAVLAGRPPGSTKAAEQPVEYDGPVEVHWVDRVANGELSSTVVRTRFERLLSDERADVVHIQHLHQMSADLIEVARVSSVPCIVSLHDLWFQCPLVHPGPKHRHPITGRAWGLACAWHERLRSLRRTAFFARRGELLRILTEALRRPNILRRQLELADLLLAPSRFVHDSFVRFGVPRRKLRLLPHGTAIERDTRRRPFEPNVRFGFVGSVAPSKGVHILCEAFSRLSGTSTLSIYGPPRDPEYRRFITAYEGPRVRYNGPFDPASAPLVYDTFDVLVVPSLVAESFNLSALEAHARGLPVIASNIGALPERVSHGRNGMLVPPRDVRALHHAMARLQDVGEVRRLAAATPRPPSMASYVNQLEMMYQGLVGGGGGTRVESVRPKEFSHG